MPIYYTRQTDAGAEIVRGALDAAGIPFWIADSTETRRQWTEAGSIPFKTTKLLVIRAQDRQVAQIHELARGIKGLKWTRLEGFTHGRFRGAAKEYAYLANDGTIRAKIGRKELVLEDADDNA